MDYIIYVLDSMIFSPLIESFLIIASYSLYSLILKSIFNKITIWHYFPAVLLAGFAWGVIHGALYNSFVFGLAASFAFSAFYMQYMFLRPRFKFNICVASLYISHVGANAIPFIRYNITYFKADSDLLIKGLTYIY
ncbi:hypothetical protein GCM10007420_21380 [Glycocaulis albus]|uniref:CPBP family intramembrane metalloprotease n=1 Tax=Glycocaulis albus TaxID=1382801 RepID=A0ABQ1XWF1_9PROT|nr:hypothetical protein GCM10007420_21380 [Glycocaulis albus]